MVNVEILMKQAVIIARAINEVCANLKIDYKSPNTKHVNVFKKDIQLLKDVYYKFIDAGNELHEVLKDVYYKFIDAGNELHEVLKDIEEKYSTIGDGLAIKIKEDLKKLEEIDSDILWEIRKLQQRSKNGKTK